MDQTQQEVGTYHTNALAQPTPTSMCRPAIECSRLAEVLFLHIVFLTWLDMSTYANHIIRILSYDLVDVVHCCIEVMLSGDEATIYVISLPCTS